MLSIPLLIFNQISHSMSSGVEETKGRKEARCIITLINLPPCREKKTPEVEKQHSSLTLPILLVLFTHWA